MSKRDLLFLILGIIAALAIIFIIGSALTGNAFFTANVIRGGFTGTSCVETDGGINYEEFGTLTLKNEGLGDEVIEDKCLSSNEGKTLIEYECGYNPATKKWYFVSRKYECSKGCKDGACISDKKTTNEEEQINTEGQTGTEKQITEAEETNTLPTETKQSFFQRITNFFKNLF